MDPLTSVHVITIGHNAFPLSLCRRTVVSLIRPGETFMQTAMDLPGKSRCLMTELSREGWCSACGPIVNGQQLI